MEPELTYNPSGYLSITPPTSALVINSPGNQKLLEITSNGDVFFRLNGEWKKIEGENDISLMFVAVISELTGTSFKDKNELICKIINNYRENKIDNILQ